MSRMSGEGGREGRERGREGGWGGREGGREGGRDFMCSITSPELSAASRDTSI